MGIWEVLDGGDRVEGRGGPPVLRGAVPLSLPLFTLLVLASTPGLHNKISA